MNGIPTMRTIIDGKTYVLRVLIEKAPTAEVKDLTGEVPEVPECVECERYSVNPETVRGYGSYHTCTTPSGRKITTERYFNDAESLKSKQCGCPKMAKPEAPNESQRIFAEYAAQKKDGKVEPLFTETPEQYAERIKKGDEAYTADEIFKGMAGVQAKPPIHIFTAKDSPADLVDAMKTCLDSGHGYTLERQDNGCVIMRKKAKASLPEEPCIERDFDGNCTGMCKEAGGKPETDTVKLTLGALIAGQKETDRRLDVLEKDKLNKDTQTQIDAIKERQNCILSEFKCFIEQFHALERAVKKLRKAVKRGKQVKK